MCQNRLINCYKYTPLRDVDNMHFFFILKKCVEEMQDGDHLHKTRSWGYILFIYMFFPNKVLIKTRTGSTYVIFNTPLKVID